MKNRGGIVIKIILLTFLLFFEKFADAQISYGDNASAGHYYNTGDSKIYYETYGTGPTVVLLHGGIYGYIDEFSKLIPELSKQHRVVAIATRGHGRSELGHQPLSYQLFAEDAYKIITHIGTDSVTVIGFSDGADAGYYIAAKHPEIVKKLIAIGGNFGYSDFVGDDKTFIDNLSAASLKKNDPNFVAERSKLMPEPTAFDEFIGKMAQLWRQSIYVTDKTITAISCPTLVIAGQDDGCPIEQYVKLYRLLRNGEIAIIPGSDHLVLFRKPELLQQIIQSFLF